MSKRRGIKDTCQTILMICGVVTALTGAVGGVKDLFDSPEEPKNVTIEQRIEVPPGHRKVHISKTMDVDASAASTEADPMVSDEASMEGPISGGVMPESGGSIFDVWGWLLGIGIGVVLIIMLRGWWSKNKQLDK